MAERAFQSKQEADEVKMALHDLDGEGNGKGKGPGKGASGGSGGYSTGVSSQQRDQQTSQQATSGSSGSGDHSSTAPAASSEGKAPLSLGDRAPQSKREADEIKMALNDLSAEENQQGKGPGSSGTTGDTGASSGQTATGTSSGNQANAGRTGEDHTTSTGSGGSIARDNVTTSAGSGQNLQPISLGDRAPQSKREADEIKLALTDLAQDEQHDRGNSNSGSGKAPAAGHSTGSTESATASQRTAPQSSGEQVQPTSQTSGEKLQPISIGDRAPQSKREAEEVKLALNDLTLEENNQGKAMASSGDNASKGDSSLGKETAPGAADDAPPAYADDESGFPSAADEKKALAGKDKVEEDNAQGSAAAALLDNKDGWPALKQHEHPLAQFLHILPKLVEEAGYNEVYGIYLGPDDSFHTKLILQKFLRANANDLTKAKEQLLGTLKWRKEFQPLKTLDKSYDKSKYGGLGYVVQLKDVPQDGDAIATFNLYGAVKDNKKTFGDFDNFIHWRVALMELTLAKLKLPTSTTPIPDYGQGPDPYQAYQIHDYMSVSFLRQDPDVKAASKRTIDIFSKYYPETLSRKFFVNVPVVMGWMFKAMTLLLSKETVRKFTVLSYGKELVGQLGRMVPEVYGGNGEGLDVQGEGPKLVDESGLEKTGEEEVSAVDKEKVGLEKTGQ